MQIFMLFILMILIIYFAWKWWGRYAADWFVDGLEKGKKQSLETKIEKLKIFKKQLQDSEVEIEVSNMLKSVQQQLEDSEKELEYLNIELDRNKK